MANNKPTDSEDPLTAPAGLQDQLTERQIEKLELEVAALKRKNGFESITSFLPIFASVLTVVTILIGLDQFQTQQLSVEERARSEREVTRTTEMQNQLRKDLDEMFRVVQDNDQTVARFSYLLDDMKRLIDAAPKTSYEISHDANIDERKITNALVDHILYHADFENGPRDVAFASRVFRNWQDYREYLKSEDRLVTLRRILEKYIKAMHVFRIKNAPFLEEIDYHEKDQSFSLPVDSAQPELLRDTRWTQLEFILSGFKDHLNLLANSIEYFDQVHTDRRDQFFNETNWDIVQFQHLHFMLTGCKQSLLANDPAAFKKSSILEFELRLCKRVLAEYFLGEDFIPGQCGDDLPVVRIRQIVRVQ